MLQGSEKFFILFFISTLWLIGLIILYPLWYLSLSYPSFFSLGVVSLILAYFSFKVLNKFSFRNLFIILFLVIKGFSVIFLIFLGLTAFGINIFLSLLFFTLAFFFSFIRVPYGIKKI